MNIPWFYYAGAAALFGVLVRKLRKKRVSTALLIVYLFLVYSSTVLNRTAQSVAAMELTPFRFLITGRLLDEVISNIIMFLPVGILSAASGLPWWTGTLSSIFIEGSQLVLRRGLCETDDLLCNTAGVFCGILLYKLILWLWKKTFTGNSWKDMYKNYVKRSLDILISLCVLGILSPVFLITAAAIKLESKGPVIFKQTRLGKDHQEFTLYKFRSMCVGAEASGVYSDKTDARVTRVGRFIRATSLDELPQAVNMLKGDMSLIGPRPPLIYHPWPVEEYTREQLRMFEVRPGITGWAQVHGRKDVEWNKRIQLNIWYVDHCSFLLDLRIFFMTIFKVLSNADNENKGETVQRKTQVPQETDAGK